MQATAIGDFSHAEGDNTIAFDAYQHAQGRYNLPISGGGAFIVGNGSSNVLRSNLIYAQGSQVQVTGSLCIQNTTGTPTNAVTPSGFVRGVVNGVQVFFPYYI